MIVKNKLLVKKWVVFKLTVKFSLYLTKHSAKKQPENHGGTVCFSMELNLLLKYNYNLDVKVNLT